MVELPERNRRAFMLFRLEGKTIRETAAIMELSPSRSWTLMRGAYLHIRARLGEAR
nr:sigma factor-like helix-turn-helix DNA-binding protein [Paracoccus sp. IB05]